MRFLKFNTVGVLGWVVQALTLGLLVHLFQVHYLAATALAVEAAVLHNFLWHRRWTWADRPTGSPLSAFVRFNLSNGFVSLLGNLAFMRLFVGSLAIEPVLANLFSVALCSVINYLLADRFVFSWYPPR